MKKNEVRQEKILTHLIDEYLLTNEPVSSGKLVKKYIKNVSPATVRIDLYKLEQKNLIYQPHTSAGRIPTILGLRKYIESIRNDLQKTHFDRSKVLRKILISNYHDTSLALHYIMQFTAKETEQLSFVAEPEIAYGFLKKMDVFKIDYDKLLFVISLDSGLDKTIIVNCNYDITEQQLKALVRYMNDELTGLMLYDIQNKYLKEIENKFSESNKLLGQFLKELQKVFEEIGTYFINFDGNINFLEQPEFDSKKKILTFLSLTQRQDYLTNLMQENPIKDGFGIVLGEDFGNTNWNDYVLLFSKYDIFGVPGYLGVISPIRMNYRKTIPIIRDIARTISETTKKGMVVPAYEIKKEK